jgi:hypothetical protein
MACDSDNYEQRNASTEIEKKTEKDIKKETMTVFLQTILQQTLANINIRLC